MNPYATTVTLDTTPKRTIRGWRSFCFFLVWVFAIANLFRYGAFPDDYRIRVFHETPPFPYPWVGVLWLTGFMVSQAIVLYVILRPERYAWDLSDTLIALILQIGMLLFFAISTGHPPPYYAWFLLWIFISTGALLVLSCIAAGIWVYDSTRQNR